MRTARSFRSLRRHLAELVVVFVGVAAAFAVENLRESLNERAVGDQYLIGFRQDLTADLAMLQEQEEARRAQLGNALVTLEFFEGRAIDPQRFFDAYLYDPTFSSIPFLVEGPWDNTASNRSLVETLLRDVRIENGVRLVVANLEYPGTGLLDELDSVRSQVARLLELIPDQERVGR
jgi:hypothetical protein